MKQWLEEHYYAKAGKGTLCTLCEGTQWEQLDCSLARDQVNRSKIHPLPAALCCSDVHIHTACVNGNNSGIFIVISYGNGLIGILSHQNKDKKRNISVPVNVLTDAWAKTGRPHFLLAWYGNSTTALVLFIFTANNCVRGSHSSSCGCRCFFESSA